MNGPSAKREQQERRTIITNEQSKLRPGDSAASTMFEMSRLANDLEGRQSARDYLAGQDEGVFYPKLPATSPWSGSGPQPGPEEPLGYSVNDLLPTGEPHEVAASIAELSATVSVAEADNGGAPLAAASPADVAAPPTSSFARASTSPVGDGDGANHSTVRNPVPNLIRRPRRKL
jgi:hypothetical protein